MHGAGYFEINIITRNDRKFDLYRLKQQIKFATEISGTVKYSVFMLHSDNMARQPQLKRQRT